MNQAVGKMISYISIKQDFIMKPQFKSPEMSIRFGKSQDRRRKNELNLDLNPIKEKIISRFHWDKSHFSLEFENELFLNISISNDEIIASIDTTCEVTTDDRLVYRIARQNGLQYDWTPFETASNFTQKRFYNIHLAEQCAWLYFRDTRDLLFIYFVKDTDDNWVLLWEENE